MKGWIPVSYRLSYWQLFFFFSAQLLTFSNCPKEERIGPFHKYVILPFLYMNPSAFVSNDIDRHKQMPFIFKVILFEGVWSGPLHWQTGVIIHNLIDITKGRHYNDQVSISTILQTTYC